MGKPVIAGRKTWESFPRRPLPGRPNIVVTRDRDYRAEGADVVTVLDPALDAGRAKLGRSMPESTKSASSAAARSTARRCRWPTASMSPMCWPRSTATRVSRDRSGIWMWSAAEDFPAGEKDSHRDALCRLRAPAKLEAIDELPLNPDSGLAIDHKSVMPAFSRVESTSLHPYRVSQRARAPIGCGGLTERTFHALEQSERRRRWRPVGWRRRQWRRPMGPGPARPERTAGISRRTSKTSSAGPGPAEAGAAGRRRCSAPRCSA